jgi:tetratricopeptide (TPR) repeat protein
VLKERCANMGYYEFCESIRFSFSWQSLKYKNENNIESNEFLLYQLLDDEASCFALKTNLNYHLVSCLVRVHSFCFGDYGIACWKVIEKFLNDINYKTDINTIKLLYKIKPDITNKKESNGDYLPGLVLGTKSEINSEKLEEAKNYVKKAPKLPIGYINLAEEYVSIKDYEKAIKHLERALELADKDEMRAIVYFNLAVTNFYLGSLDDAKTNLQFSMQIEDSDEKHYLLGEIYLLEGNEQNAIEEYSKLLENNPKNIEYAIALTNIHIINRDYLKARKVLKNFFFNNPTERKNPRFKPYGILIKGL